MPTLKVQTLLNGIILLKIDCEYPSPDIFQNIYYFIESYILFCLSCIIDNSCVFYAHYLFKVEIYANSFFFYIKDFYFTIYNQFISLTFYNFSKEPKLIYYFFLLSNILTYTVIFPPLYTLQYGTPSFQITEPNQQIFGSSSVLTLPLVASVNEQKISQSVTLLFIYLFWSLSPNTFEYTTKSFKSQSATVSLFSKKLTFIRNEVVSQVELLSASTVEAMLYLGSMLISMTHNIILMQYQIFSKVKLQFLKQLNELQNYEYQFCMQNSTLRSIHVPDQAVEMIIIFQVSSKQQYEAKYQNPIWPGAFSGVTIGVRYDLAHVSPGEFEQIKKEFIVLVANLLFEVQLKGFLQIKKITPALQFIQLELVKASMGNCDTSKKSGYGNYNCFDQYCTEKCCTASGYCPSSTNYGSCYYYYDGTASYYTDLASAVCQSYNNYIGMVVGLSVGSVVLVTLIIVGIICYFKRKRRIEQEKRAQLNKNAAYSATGFVGMDPNVVYIYPPGTYPNPMPHQIPAENYVNIPPENMAANMNPQLRDPAIK